MRLPLSIANKIILGFAIMMLLQLIIGSVNLLGMQKQHEVVSGLLQTELQFGMHILEAQKHVGDLRRYEKDTFINLSSPEKVAEYKKKWDESLAKTHKAIDAGAGLAKPEQSGQLQELKNYLAQYSQGFEATFSQLSAGQFATTGDANLAFGKYKQPVHLLGEQIGKIAKTAIEHVEGIEPRVDSIKNEKIKLSLLVGAFTLAIGLGSAWAITQAVTRPLNDMQNTVAQMNQTGQIGQQLLIHNQDEIGTTSIALNQLFGELGQVISLANRNSGELINTAHQLSAASDQITHASHAQSQSAISTASAVEQMSANVNTLVDSSQSMEQESRHAAHLATEGVSKAQQSIQDINRIANSINHSSSLILQLNQRSDEIGSIVMVIKEIADQTNLLALNAAIEAARAGEQGRGFAVVADEVRKLAERTTHATVEISSKISAVQNDTSSAAQEMRTAGTLVENGVKGTQLVAQSLSEIEAVSLSAAEHVAQISHAIREQNIASQAISHHMEQIAHASEENYSAANNTQTLAGRLTEIAQNLDNTIRRFKA
ncbi:methyl-accepting chemotaxis protein [Chitinibacter sp. S2-10]|uniref:methyl-accepting chemotaxis protein n=1 Tax=Chitinibacter sp. S2-10 TaxID=3373597 RepID=UPI003977CC90